MDGQTETVKYVYDGKMFLYHQELQGQAVALSPGLEEIQSTLDEMKAAISPSDARILSQKVWSLNQQHTDLMRAVAQSLCDAEDKLDLIPAFDSKYVEQCFILRSLI
jgi:hypothetical protein